MAQLPLSPLVLYCPLALLRSGEMGQQELSPGLARTHSPCPLLAPRAPAAAPSPWQLPRGPGCAWDPPSWPHISCQVFSQKYSRAMQGGSWDPPRFEQPLHPSWNCCHPSPWGPSRGQPRPLALCQRGSGCSLTKDGARGVPGDCLSPCEREELGGAKCQLSQRGDTLDPEGWQQGDSWGSQVPALPAWGHLGSRRLAARGQLGVPGVLEGPVFPQGLGGIWVLWWLAALPGLRGVLCLSPCPPRAHQLPPCATVGTTGCSPPPPRGPRPLSPPCAVPCHALPRCLGGHCPTPHPLHAPLGPPGPASAGLRHRGERPRRCLRLPAALLCFQEEKTNGNSLV
ncbi:uncharacterized protein LOC127060407 [Serinus canaria]|uniref:uncharacterized protein LOC127060407 n=1 Tax=Serinus canaria TaxID=9135 RepID=UPI0021CCDE5D|nr:uncharacterized protein LOC127060407 [Serinus canaria]